MLLSQRILLLSWLSLAVLGGCTILEKSEQSKGQAPLTSEEVREFIEQWEATRPQIERLDALEDDLALIVEEVNKHSKLSDLPVQYAHTRVTDYLEADHYESEEPTKPATESSSPEATAATVERQIYAVHLGLYLQEDSAQRGWKTLHHRYPQLLNGLTALVKQLDKPEQDIFSLRAGPFDSEQTADLMCNYLRTYKYKCATTLFDGNAIQGS